MASAAILRPQRRAAPSFAQLTEHLHEEENDEGIDASSGEEDQVELHASHEESDEFDSESSREEEHVCEAPSRQERTLQGRNGFMWNRDPPNQRGHFQHENVLCKTGGPTSIMQVDFIGEIFQLFIQDDLLHKVVDYTNKHAHQFIAEGAPVAQWVVRLTHTQLVPGSKHAWCKNPLVLVSISS